VGTVGTTSTAAVDPVAELAQICREEKVWLHLDAAYGGAMALLPEAAWVKEGWSEADSIVVNPHKMLFIPFDFSCLYLKDLERLREVFTLVPEYLRGDADGRQINYMDYGVQLGRRFRALKAWMVWRTFGREGMTSRIRESLRLARLLADWVEGDKRCELRAPVTMGIVCFSVADDREIELVQNVNLSGKAYLTVTRLDGRNAVRAGFGNLLTTEAHLHSIWKLICSSLSAG
jgi:aromatic-L-amino-acid decarboxylase